MEIKINKEILTYQETIFFGLTMRQFFCSALAVVTALGLYALLSRVMGRESVSWICILGAAPFAVAGFFQYNGMKLEKFAWVWFKSCFLLSITVFGNHRIVLSRKPSDRRERRNDQTL